MATFDQIQNEIASMLDIPDEELTDEQRQAMDDYLAELADMEVAKVDGFGQFVKVQSALADACTKEAQRLARKANSATRRISWLKKSYLEIMFQRGLKKVCGNAYAISIRDSETVVVESPDALPAIYVREKVTREPDKGVIKEALKGGLEVPGCYIQQMHSLQIR